MSEFEEGLATGILLADGGSGAIVQKTFTENGTYHAIADAVDGYDPVIVAVPIGSKSITKNGIYYAADDDLRGFDPVNVNVPMHWTFKPGETVPESMITPDTQIEEDAPPSSEDVPYPTQEDPQRVIRPQFTFEDFKRVYRESDGQYVAKYGGVLKDNKTGEVLGTPAYKEHLWRDNEKFEIVSWEFSGRSLRIQYRYDWFSPDVTYWDTLDFGIDCGNYRASGGSGQNTSTISKKE